MIDKYLSKQIFLLYALLILSAVAYYFLSYHTLRENFSQVISLYGFLFINFIIAYKYFSITAFKTLLAAGITFRLLLLFSVPNLSDDVYRFIWDGRLAANGINPFSHLPAEIVQMPLVTGITKELFTKLNSPEHYTIYPPILQGIFWLTAKLFPQNIFASILFMKAVIFHSEILNIFLIIQILKKLNLSKHTAVLYILNPLLITELTGNVHFDGLMILSVLLAFLLLLKNKWQSSAFVLGLGIATKIFPLIFIPLIFFRLSWKRGLMYSVISGLTALILFSLVIDSTTLNHMLNSIDLFFRNFEFNASIYYVVRWIGESVMGYNIIAWAGPMLSITAAVIIFLIAVQKKYLGWYTFFTKALFIICIWFLFATTVHPWYICLPVALSVFTPFRFAIAWSFTATLSYAAYHFNPVHENLWHIAAGYLFVLLYAIFEMKKIPGKTKIQQAGL